MWLTVVSLAAVLISVLTGQGLLLPMGASAAGSPSLQQTQAPDGASLAAQLIEAIQKGDEEKTRALLKAGAKAQGEDGFGRPLQEAINNNRVSIARILVEAGAALEFGGPNPPPLRAAVESGHVEMVRALLSLGAKVNGAGAGASPLWFALMMYRIEIARVLIAAGADVKAEKQYAESHRQQHIVRALQEALGPVPPPMAVEEVIHRLEVRDDAFELGFDESFPGWDNSEADIARAKSELASRLQKQPQDTQTLLLCARLSLAGGHADSLPAPEAALDRVLTAQPRNAEALYYKGRIYGRPVAAGTGKRAMKRFDVNRAVSFLRQAVELAPKDLKYRQTLALFLADQGHPGEAKAVLRAGRKDDPMIKLLEDLEALPIPEGAELLFSHPFSSAATMNLISGAGDHLHLRVRTYRIAKSVADIEAFYASRMPGFRFLPEAPDTSGEPATEELGRWYDQFLRTQSGTLRPSRDRQDLPEKREAGFQMLLVELPNDPELGRKLGPGENNCYLIFVNYRN